MGYGPGMFGMGGFLHIIGVLVSALFCLVIFAVIVGLIFLLVRFLLVATAAAHLYIAKNRAAVSPPVAAAAPVAPVVIVADDVATTPLPKTRAPKPPKA